MSNVTSNTRKRTPRIKGLLTLSQHFLSPSKIYINRLNGESATWTKALTPNLPRHLAIHVFWPGKECSTRGLGSSEQTDGKVLDMRGPLGGERKELDTAPRHTINNNWKTMNTTLRIRLCSLDSTYCSLFNKLPTIFHRVLKARVSRGSGGMPPGKILKSGPLRMNFQHSGANRKKTSLNFDFFIWWKQKLIRGWIQPLMSFSWKHMNTVFKLG